MPETPNQNKNDITDSSADFEFDAMPVKAPVIPNYTRRIQILMAAIFVATIAYTGAWFWVAAVLEDKVRTEAAKGVVFCTDIAARGYPFRIGFSCSKAAYAAPDESLNIEALNLRTAAQIYAPGHFIGEVASPLTISVKDQPGFMLMFETARASVRGISGLPQRVSLEIQNPVFAETAAASLQIGSANLIALHMRQGENNQIDVALSIDSAKIKTAPVFNLSSDAAISGATRFDAAIKSKTKLVELLRGNDGQIRNATLAFVDGGSVTISGPFSISTASIKADKAGALIDNAGKLAVALGANVDNLTALKAMAVTDAINLTITIKDGNVSIGFIPLGTIPAL
jgi:hypothetical protein